MKAFLVIYIAIFVVKLVVGAENSTNDTSVKHTICTTCHCDSKTKTLNCANNNLFKLFASDDWISLNKTGLELNTVLFDNNGIPEVTQFPELKIRHLSLRHNLIKTIVNAAFRNLDELEHLDLSYNKLTYEGLKPTIFEGKYAPKNYEPLKSVKILDLGNNLLHSLNQDVFVHFPNLEQLSLDSNPFTVIDQTTTIAISGIPNLQFLDMSYMELKELPEHIFHAPRQLKTLNLTGNLFETIPEAIEKAINLENLNLDENIIQNLTGKNKFPVLEKLQTLSVSYMATLHNIGSGAFSNLIALQKLTCTNNPRLTNIHPQAFSRPGKEDKLREEWPPIRELYLHNNNLSSLDSSLLSRWDEVEKLDIRLNPWTCDCESQWFIDTLIPIIKTKTPSLLNEVVCDHPTEMLGREMHDIFESGKHLRCLDYYGSRPERDGAILIGVLLGLLVGIPLSLGIILIYKRGCFGVMGYAPGPADYSRAFYKRAGLREELTS